MLIAAYTRVSTGKQAELGLSLEAQEKAIAAYCDLYGLHIGERYCDAGVSGKSVSGRPQFRRLIAAIERGDCAGVVVYMMDRAFRSIRDALEFFDLTERLGVDFFSVQEQIDTSKAIGRLFRNQILAFAQFGREQTGEKTRDTLHNTKKSPGGSPILDDRLRRDKLLVGQPPYGYRWKNKKLEVDPMERELVLEVFRHKRAGSSSRRTAEHMRNGGWTGRAGKPISHQAVCAILKTPEIYQGGHYGLYHGDS